MIDYALLGALLGSAWYDANKGIGGMMWKQSQYDTSRIENMLRLKGNEAFHTAFKRTMFGACYACGTGSEVGRDGRGVYICRLCMEGMSQ